ncbi:MAG: DUF1003 domain-containing protein [Candidatus Tumulicola sp.]
MDSDYPTLPTHVEQTVRSIAELHAKHDRQASLYQRAIDRLINQLGQPAAAVVIGIIIALWIGTNIVLFRLHFVPFDPAPFQYLQSLVTTAALFMTVLILTSQRHENLLADRRAQLTLELAMVSEQKIAKLIELVEDQRLDNPQIANRIDEEAAEMSKPADPQAILEAIRETQSKMIDWDSAAAP